MSVVTLSMRNTLRFSRPGCTLALPPEQINFSKLICSNARRLLSRQGVEGQVQPQHVHPFLPQKTERTARGQVAHQPFKGFPIQAARPRTLEVGSPEWLARYGDGYNQAQRDEMAARWEVSHA